MVLGYEHPDDAEEPAQGTTKTRHGHIPSKVRVFSYLTKVR